MLCVGISCGTYVLLLCLLHAYWIILIVFAQSALFVCSCHTCTGYNSIAKRVCYFSPIRSRPPPAMNTSTAAARFTTCLTKPGHSDDAPRCRERRSHCASSTVSCGRAVSTSVSSFSTASYSSSASYSVMTSSMTPCP